MENLIYDVQSNILNFMTTTDMINLMNSSENAKLMFQDLSIHIGFIIHCDTVISDEQIEMFHSNNIKYKLLEIIDVSMYYDNVSYYIEIMIYLRLFIRMENKDGIKMG